MYVWSEFQNLKNFPNSPKGAEAQTYTDDHLISDLHLPHICCSCRNPSTSTNSCKVSLGILRYHTIGFLPLQSQFLISTSSIGLIYSFMVIWVTLLLMGPQRSTKPLWISWLPLLNIWKTQVLWHLKAISFLSYSRNGCKEDAIFHRTRSIYFPSVLIITISRKITVS